MFQTETLMFKEGLVINGSPDVDLKTIILPSFEVLQMVIIILVAFLKMKGEISFAVGWEVVGVIWKIVWSKISS